MSLAQAVDHSAANLSDSFRVGNLCTYIFMFLLVANVVYAVQQPPGCHRKEGSRHVPHISPIHSLPAVICQERRKTVAILSHFYGVKFRIIYALSRISLTLENTAKKCKKKRRVHFKCSEILKNFLKQHLIITKCKEQPYSAATENSCG